MIKLNDLYELQKELDNYILENKKIDLEKKEILTNKILAFHVEVSELANAIRSFKYWSNKEPMSRKIILEEYVDTLHFFLSVGNELGFRAKEVESAYLRKRQINIDRVKEGY